MPTNFDDIDQRSVQELLAMIATGSVPGNFPIVRLGAIPTKAISAASTNSTVIKSSAGTLYLCVAMSINAAPRYLKLYDKATAPTVGTDVPVQTYMIPGSTVGAGFVVPIPERGLSFVNGIGFALTTGIADNNVGAVAAGDITVNFAYL